MSLRGTIVRLAVLAMAAAPVLAADRPAPIHVDPRSIPPTEKTAGPALTAADVRTIVSNAAAEAQRQGQPAVIAVMDREENILGVFRMTGAPRRLRLSGRSDGAAVNDGRHGLDGVTLAPSGDAPGAGIVVAGAGVPDPTILAALSKAGTAAVFETRGNAFTTRTASFIIQEHFPPAIDFTSSGPLFGVQFSNLTCTDVKKVDPANGNLALPLGLAGDPGGVPLYKGGEPVGAIGVESDGLYTVDFTPAIKTPSVDEIIALAGTRGFESPPEIRGDQIIVNGLRFPFVNSDVPDPATTAVGSGDFVPGFVPRDGFPTIFVPVTVAGQPATADPRFFPFVSSPIAGGLTAAEVERIIGQALAQAYRTRAAIRAPLGSFAQVNVAVVDRRGTVLGIARTPDAPVFGFDVSAQKARAAAFFSAPEAAATLVAAGFSEYVVNARADGLNLDGSVAFTDRANGFLSRPFFPDGINDTAPGPFSRPITEWSAFNVGLQIDLLRDTLLGVVMGTHALGPPCVSIPAIAGGIQIFPGSVPLYKNGALVGGIGISGDGVDQDDIVAAFGSAGFETPLEIRSDRVFVRSVRLPWQKFPRHPDL